MLPDSLSWHHKYLRYILTAIMIWVTFCLRCFLDTMTAQFHKNEEKRSEEMSLRCILSFLPLSFSLYKCIL